jgi:RimJ/RimL family protein N-acetyltransferase
MNFDDSYIAIKTEALTLECARVPQDEETFGVPIARLDLFEVRDQTVAIRDYKLFSDWCDNIRIMLCSIRIAQSRIKESTFLEDRGFRFIELNYVPYFDDLQLAKVSTTEIDILPATSDDQEHLTALARRSIQIGRFHQDPRVNGASSGRRYSQWVRRAFENPNQRVLKCVRAGDIVGFFVVETSEPGGRFWSLIGFDPEFAGRGLGYSTWTAMLRYHQLEGVQKITTSISSHNVAVMNLYVKLGFRFSEPQITLHWHPVGSKVLGQ